MAADRFFFDLVFWKKSSPKVRIYGRVYYGVQDRHEDFINIDILWEEFLKAEYADISSEPSWKSRLLEPRRNIKWTIDKELSGSERISH